MAFRTHNFSLRLTELEIANYERLAEKNGVPVGEWMRNVLNWEVKVKEEQANLPAQRGANFLVQSRSVERTEQKRILKPINPWKRNGGDKNGK